MKHNQVIHLNTRRPQSRAAARSRMLARRRKAAAYQLISTVFTGLGYLLLMVCLSIGALAMLAIF